MNYNDYVHAITRTSFCLRSLLEYNWILLLKLCNSIEHAHGIVNILHNSKL